MQTTMTEAPQPQRTLRQRKRPNFAGMDGEDEGGVAAHISECEAQGAQEVVKAKRVRVHLGKTNLSTFARINEMVAELEQGHGDAEKQMMQMRENNNELQDEMKKAKEAWAKEKNELADEKSLLNS